MVLLLCPRINNYRLKVLLNIQTAFSIIMFPIHMQTNSNSSLRPVVPLQTLIFLILSLFHRHQDQLNLP